MTQCGVATVDNPPPGATDVFHVTDSDISEDQHGPANAWHYMGGARETSVAPGGGLSTVATPH